MTKGVLCVTKYGNFDHLLVFLGYFTYFHENYAFLLHFTFFIMNFRAC